MPRRRRACPPRVRGKRFLISALLSPIRRRRVGCKQKVDSGRGHRKRTRQEIDWRSPRRRRPGRPPSVSRRPRPRGDLISQTGSSCETNWQLNPFLTGARRAARVPLSGERCARKAARRADPGGPPRRERPIAARVGGADVIRHFVNLSTLNSRSTRTSIRSAVVR